MNRILRVGLMGDYDAGITAHQYIPTDWLSDLTQHQVREFDAFWCVPGSPYKSRKAVLEKIQYARTANVPYLGTCGGYQHAILEFAIHQLGLAAVILEEEDPQGGDAPHFGSAMSPDG